MYLVKPGTVDRQSAGGYVRPMMTGLVDVMHQDYWTAGLRYSAVVSVLFYSSVSSTGAVLMLVWYGDVQRHSRRPMTDGMGMGKGMVGERQATGRFGRPRQGMSCWS